MHLDRQAGVLFRHSIEERFLQTVDDLHFQHWSGTSHTLQTMILVFLKRSLLASSLSAAIAITFAVTLFLHVATWFVIGVVTPVTFILSALGTTCIVINLAAILYRRNSYVLRE